MPEINDEWFNRYTFIQPLGQGGMGVIYLAEDKKHDRARCVVKQLISKYTDPEEQREAVRLFQREADLLRTLDHPGVVRFFDEHTTEDGKYFLVMDYVQGQNLESAIANFGAFMTEEAVKIGIQICEVLEYLHEQDPPIVYRDLKPSNLMLTPEGQVVFIDFGISRNLVPKTQATRVVTAGYSPPEQYFGRPEIRSDLYALGATLGHLLTGVRPKPLTTSTPMLIKPDVLPSMDSLVRRLTAHNPEERPASAREVRYTLYRIYTEIHPDFELPDEVTMGNPDNDLSSPSIRQLVDSVMPDQSSSSGPSGRMKSAPQPVQEEEPVDMQKMSSHRIRQANIEKGRLAMEEIEKELEESPTIWQKIFGWLGKDKK